MKKLHHSWKGNGIVEYEETNISWRSAWTFAVWTYVMGAATGGLIVFAIMYKS